MEPNPIFTFGKTKQPVPKKQSLSIIIGPLLVLTSFDLQIGPPILLLGA